MAQTKDAGRIREIYQKMEQGNYLNSKVASIGGMPFSMRDILIRAPLTAGLNVYAVGGTGRGKTQLANDLVAFFGDSACYAMGRPDFEPSELLKQVNLSGLKGAKTDRDLVQLTENVTKNFFMIDELNRAPPVVQNYFFDFFDGKLVHAGKILALGNEGYSVGFATGNLGDGEYVGISDSDRALLDRMHMIVKLDYGEFRPKPHDLMKVLADKNDPRANFSGNGNGFAEDIIWLNGQFKKQTTPMILPYLGVFFTEGLDYLENTKGHSKMALPQWPNVEGIRADSDEGLIFPLSPRATASAQNFAKSLKMIAEAKGEVVNDVVPLYLDALRFTVPFSGVISPAYVSQRHDGDVYSAFDSIFEGIRTEIDSRKNYLEEAVWLAEKGKKDASLLDEIAKQGEGRWMPVREAIEDEAKFNAGGENAK